jgi:hypothetical protein
MTMGPPSAYFTSRSSHSHLPCTFTNYIVLLTTHWKYFLIESRTQTLISIWSQLFYVIYWDSSTSHYKFLLLVPIKVTPINLRINNVIDNNVIDNILGNVIGMNVNNLSMKRGQCSEANYINNILLQVKNLVGKVAQVV